MIQSTLLKVSLAVRGLQRAQRAGLAIAAAGGLMTLLLIQQARFYSFFIDDSYISLVYVRNWLAGNGLTYNGLLVEGFSNFLWVAILSVLGLLGADPVLAAKWLGIVASHLALLLVFHFGRLLAGHWLAGAAAGLLLLASGPFVAWSVGGLEGCLFAFLLLLAAYGLYREHTDLARRSAWSAVPAVLLALTRPEGIGLVVVLAAWQFAMLLLDRSRPALVYALRWGVLAAVGCAAFWLWRYLRYDALLPTTVYAKSADLELLMSVSAARLRPLLREWSLPLLALLPGAAGLLCGSRNQRLALSLLASLLAGYGAFIVVAGADWMPMHRFLVPLLPLASLVIAAGLAALITRWRQPGSSAHGLLLLAGLALPFAQMLAWTNRERPRALAAGLSTVWQQEALGRAIGAMDDDSLRLAVTDAGAIAYYGRVPVLDLYGLNESYIARLPGGFGGRCDIDYVLAFEPDWIEVHYVLNAAGSPVLFNYGCAPQLYYSPEFQRWYAPDPSLPLSPFKRREQPLFQTMMDNFYSVELVAAGLPAALPVGQAQSISLTISNTGTGVWIAWPNLQAGTVVISARLLAEDGAVAWHGLTPLSQDIPPGARLSAAIELSTLVPPGDYTLELDLVLWGLSYFNYHGPSAIIQPLTITAPAP